MSFDLEKRGVVIRRKVPSAPPAKVRIVRKQNRFKTTAECFQAMGLVNLGGSIWTFPKCVKKLQTNYPKWYKRISRK